MTNTFAKFCGIIAISSLLHHVSFGQKNIPHNLTLRAPIEKVTIKEVAAKNISAYNSVRSGSVEYVAGETIILGPGFQLSGNGHFSARIEPVDISIPVPVAGGLDEDFDQTQLFIKTYPNPSVDDTQIEYWLPDSESVKLSVYDNEGRQVGVLVQNQVQSKGKHKVTFESKHLPSGIYSCVIITAGSKKVCRIFKR